MKISTIVPLACGVAIGYVLGAAAGRGRYQQIKRGISDLINHPKVQETVFDLADQTKASSHHLPHPAADIVDTAATRLQEALTDPHEDTAPDHSPDQDSSNSDR